jgi:hypothetical protein
MPARNDSRLLGISKNRLKDEVDALEDKVYPEACDAIGSVLTI